MAINIPLMLKRFGHILSFAEYRKRRKLNAIHKMPVDEAISKAIALCDFWLEHGNEPVLDVRRASYVDSRSNTIGDILSAIQMLHKAVMSEDDRDRYIDQWPTWLLDRQSSMKLDGYLVDEHSRYTNVKESVERIRRMLMDISKQIEGDDYKKFKRYYITKPKKVYLEVVKVVSQLL